MKTKKKPLSLYIHIPFCKKKCLYCDFLSAPACAKEREDYVKALLREISVMAKLCKEYRIISVFFGGGTPSLLSSTQMRRIMAAIRNGYNLSKDAEITVECNPATANLEKLSHYRECGINRLSIGLQSANDKELKELGRIHNYRQFLDTFDAARKAGFTNINVDIMSALPGQTYESYIHTLTTVINLQPEHISAYSLIIEEGTPFYERYSEEVSNKVAQNMECATTYPPLPDEDTERRMYHDTAKLLQKEGYLRYEISNYAKKGYECRHNMTYWTGIEYLGFGLGASSFFNGYRFKNITDINDYIQKCGKVLLQNITSGGCNAAPDSPLIEETVALTVNDKMEEYMFLGLRLKKGVSIPLFQQQFGVPVENVYGKEIEKLKQEGLLLQRGNRLCLSKKGTDLANYAMSHFILDK